MLNSRRSNLNCSTSSATKNAECKRVNNKHDFQDVHVIEPKFLRRTAKVIIHKSRGEVSIVEQDKIESVLANLKFVSKFSSKFWAVTHLVPNASTPQTFVPPQPQIDLSL